MKPFTPAIQTLYQDLVQQVHDTIERAGSVYTRTIGGAEYAYAKQMIGTSREDVFLGRADSPDVQHRMERIRQEAASARQRRKIVVALKAAGVPAPTSALGAVLDAMAGSGLLHQAVVVGTAAYQCFPPIVGAALPSAALMTQDADLATASLAISADEGDQTMESILKRADKTFAPLQGLDPRTPPASFRSASGFMVDLLTPQLRRSDPNPMPLAGLKAGAVPLQHLRWLIETPVLAAALHGSGVALRVPSPARFAIHKLIVAQKRAGDRSKRTKDLQQAKALIEVLQASDPFALSDAYEMACAQREAGWKVPIQRSLHELGTEASALLA